MAFSKDTLSIVFHVNYNNKTYNIEDDYDYAGESIGLTKLKALAKVTTPAGDVILDGITTPDWSSPLIDHDVSLESAVASLSGSLDDDTGAILDGDYVIDYLLQRFFTLSSIAATNQIVITGVFDETVFVPGESIVMADNSDPENNGTFTISSVSDDGANTTIVVSETTLVSDGAPSGTIYGTFERQFTQCYDFVPTNLTVESAHSCKNSRLTIDDETVYDANDSVQSKSWVIKSPLLGNGSNVVADVTSTADQVKIKPIYTGSYQIALAVTIEHTLDSGIVVDYIAYSSSTHTVTCNRTIIQAYSCIKAALNKLNCGCGPISPVIQCKVDQLQSEIILLNIAGDAGDEANVEAHIANIYTILGELDCDCSAPDNDQDPVLVVSSVYSIQLNAADVYYNNESSGAPYSNIQEVIDWVLSFYNGGGIVFAQPSIQATYPANFSKYNSNVNLDFIANGYGLEMLFDYSATGPSSEIGLKVNDDDTGIQLVVAATSGWVRAYFWRSGNDLKIVFLSSNGNRSEVTYAVDFSSLVSLLPFWTVNPGTGVLKAMRVARINMAVVS